MIKENHVSTKKRTSIFYQKNRKHIKEPNRNFGAEKYNGLNKKFTRADFEQAEQSIGEVKKAQFKSSSLMRKKE